MRKYKQQFRRKEDRFDPHSIATQVVKERMDLLRQAVNDLFKLKVDKRIKKKAS